MPTPSTQTGGPGAERDPAAFRLPPAAGVRLPLEVERIQARDPAAIEALVDAYLPQVLRAARAAGLSAQEAEEVTQETFLTFLEVAPRFEGRSHVRTFLFGILYRKVSEARRQLARERDYDPIDEIVESRFAPDGSWVRPPRSADAELNRREIREALAECLAEAPATQRLAFHLRQVDELSTPEVCAILDVTPTNLGVMLYRLRNRARECLESKGVEA